MNKKLLARACGFAAAGMILAGCTATMSEQHEPPVFTSPTPATVATIPAGSWLDELEPGTIVWCLRHTTGLDPATVEAYRYLARGDGYIIVSAQYPELYPNPEDLIEAMREQTAEGWCNMYLFPDVDCYERENPAWDAACTENGRGCD